MTKKIHEISGPLSKKKRVQHRNIKDINKCVLLGCQFEKVSHCFELCLLKFANGRPWFFKLESKCSKANAVSMLIRTSTYWSSDHGILWVLLLVHSLWIAPEIWSGFRPEKGVMKTTCFSREISMQRDFSGQERRQAGTLWRIWDEVSWLTVA